MIDAKDPGTAEIPLTIKRGRGRPRKADALTPAQRAARYRATRVLVPFDRLGVSDDQFDDLLAERDNAYAQLATQEAEIASLRAQLAKRDVTKTDRAELDRVHAQGYGFGVADVEADVVKLFDHMALMRVRKSPQTVPRLRTFFERLRKS